MDDERLARRVADLLGDRTIATAESCTAGRVASVLACVENAVDMLAGGIVAYQEEIKRSRLGVTAPSVLSAAAAEEMARGARDLFDADVTVSTTGVAGDEPQEGVPPGTVYMAVSVGDRVESATHRFEGPPEAVCDQARRAALELVIAALSSAD